MRKFAAAALGFALGIAAAEYIGFVLIFCIAAAVSGAMLLALWFMRRNRRVRVAALILLALAVGCGWRMLFETWYYSPAAALDGQTMTITATVRDYPKFYEYGATVEAELVGVGGGSRVVVKLHNRYILQPGDRITFEAELKLPEQTEDFDALAFYKARRVFLHADNISESIVVERRQGFSLRWLSAEIRHALNTKLDTLFSGEPLGLARALVTGDKSAMPDSLLLAASASGLAHVLAISGQHVTILAGMAVALFRNRRRAALLIISITFFFVLSSGGSPSAIRACVMHTLAIGALLVRRDGDALTSMSAALALLLAINPFSITDVGLQLSFAATLGLVLCLAKANEYVSDRIPFKGKRIRSVVLALTLSINTTLIATLFTAPLIAVYFGITSLYGIFANLLTLWLIPPALIGGVLSAFFGFFTPTSARLVADATTYIYRCFEWTCFFFTRLPLSIIDMRNVYNIAWMVSAYGIVAAWRLCGRKTGRYAACLAAFTLACALSLGEVVRREGMSVTLLDVGQGQCVVALDGGNAVMVDCGGTVYGGSGNEAAKFLMLNNRRKVDTLVLTHYHADHAGGIADLLKFIDIERAALPGLSEQDSAEITALLERHGVEITYISENTEFVFADTTATIYRPVRRSGANEQGVAVKLSSGGFDMLVTGDLNSTSELILTEREQLSGIEVLVAGHHGSRFSTSEALLRETVPDVTLISVGRNNYGHPSPDALLRMHFAACDIFRTDYNGSISIRVSKEGF